MGNDSNVALSEVSAAGKNCQVCALLLRTVKRHLNDDDDPNVHIVREGSALKIGSEGHRILRLCSDSEDSVGPDTGIQISFPVLPEAENPARFALLRAWLRWCDEAHDCNKHDAKSKPVLPTRLLYVGEPDLDVLRLYCPKKKDRMKYIALSHCWGELTPENQHQSRTTKNNINRRLKQFSFSELPKTFKDAVKVTRELDIQYLWIDSLCIIQGDWKDWEYEAKRMEDVFASAYCTIAATSAVNSNAGFLDRNITNEYVYVQNASGRRFYVCADMDDFDNDVEKARLNTRAWVMQERVLSGRTIHFSAKHAYFECGEGVYCENLTRMESSHRKEFFTLDPKFPNRLLKSGSRSTMEFIHFLFENYSKRGLSERTDRAVAISGLETRVAKALRTEKRYGIFRNYLHRNLLWQRSVDQQTERINYKTQNMPSWSWMAYDGVVQFMDIPFGGVDWINNLRFDKKHKHALIIDIGAFRNCSLQKKERCHAILDSSKTERGWIQYDITGTEDLQAERCVVVGRKLHEDQLKKTKYYILVVRPTSTNGEYERVGVGLVQSDYVVRQSLDVRVV